MEQTSPVCLVIVQRKHCGQYFDGVVNLEGLPVLNLPFQLSGT